MNLPRTLLLLTLLALSGCGSPTVAEPIAQARYANPIDRYGHFALGKPHEYASLTATTRSGRTLTLRLPNDEVFEDLAPRLVTLAENEPNALLAVVSQRDSGARLVLIQARDGALTISAQSPAIGMPNRWLNPVGVADLDGDGRAEIAAVITPHIGGTLKVYRQRGNDLIEVAAMPGFSNHVYGSTELALSTPLMIGGQMHLIVPNATRTELRILSLKNKLLVETGRCALSAPISGAVASVSPGALSVVTQAGQQIIALDTCVY